MPCQPWVVQATTIRVKVRLVIQPEKEATTIRVKVRGRVLGYREHGHFPLNLDVRQIYVTHVYMRLCFRGYSALLVVLQID
jgi:hypothetical protein